MRCDHCDTGISAGRVVALVEEAPLRTKEVRLCVDCLAEAARWLVQAVPLDAAQRFAEVFGRRPSGGCC